MIRQFNLEILMEAHQLLLKASWPPKNIEMNFLLVTVIIQDVEHNPFKVVLIKGVKTFHLPFAYFFIVIRILNYTHKYLQIL